MSVADSDKAGGQFEDFAKKYGESIADNTLQTVCEAAYAECGRSKHTYEGVTISAIHRHDAINMTFTGSVIMSDGVIYAFVIEDGDWNGTVVHEWCLEEFAEGYEPPQPNPWCLFPRHAFNLRADKPALWKVYLQWRKEAWFTELERAYNYDNHFAPGVMTSSHYTGPSSIASKRGLVWKTQSEVEAFIARPDSDFEGLPTQAELLAAWNENSA